MMRLRGLIAVALLALAAGAPAAGGTPAHRRHGHCTAHARRAAHPTAVTIAGWTWGWGWRAEAFFAARHRGSARCHAKGHARPRHGVSTSPPASGPPGQAGPSGSGAGGSPGQGAGETTTPAGGAGEGSGEPSGPPSIPHVQVTAVEYHFTLSRTTVPAGKVALEFVNAGQDEHNLNVLSGEGNLSGSFPTTLSKGVRDETLEFRHGSYTLFCSLPEHEAKGMHSTLTVE
jgi:plastocyanin